MLSAFLGNQLAFWVFSGTCFLTAVIPTEASGFLPLSKVPLGLLA